MKSSDTKYDFDTVRIFRTHNNPEIWWVKSFDKEQGVFDLYLQQGVPNPTRLKIQFDPRELNRSFEQQINNDLYYKLPPIEFYKTGGSHILKGAEHRYKNLIGYSIYDSQNILIYNKQVGTQTDLYDWNEPQDKIHNKVDLEISTNVIDISIIGHDQNLDWYGQ